MAKLAGWGGEASERESLRFGVAVAIAIGFHIAFSLFRLRTPELSKPLSDPWQLVEVAAEPEPLPPPEAVDDSAPEERTESTVRTPAQGTSKSSNDVPSSIAAGTGDATSDSDAAPTESSEFSEADWELTSGVGTTIGGARTTSRFGGGGPARNGVLLAARDLSRDALAPDLSPLVERNFPQIARMYRVEGRVTVSALLDENGVPSDIRVDSVTPEGKGFGEACARTVHQGPKWRPKLNRDGRPVATSVTYTCAFRLPKDISHTESSEGATQRIWSHSAE